MVDLLELARDRARSGIDSQAQEAGTGSIGSSFLKEEGGRDEAPAARHDVRRAVTSRARRG
jgi:hypothetical protein